MKATGLKLFTGNYIIVFQISHLCPIATLLCPKRAPGVYKYFKELMNKRHGAGYYWQDTFTDKAFPKKHIHIRLQFRSNWDYIKKTFQLKVFFI